MRQFSSFRICHSRTISRPKAKIGDTRQDKKPIKRNKARILISTMQPVQGIGKFKSMYITCIPAFTVQ